MLYQQLLLDKYSSNIKTKTKWFQETEKDLKLLKISNEQLSDKSVFRKLIPEVIFSKESFKKSQWK